MNIVYSYDPSVLLAPVGFKPAMEAAADYLEALVTDNITINVRVGWGDVAGEALIAGSIAVGGPQNSPLYTFPEVVSALTANATTTVDKVSLPNLAGADPTTTGSFFLLANAEAKAMGLLPANQAGIDIAVGFNKTTAWNFDTVNRGSAGLVDLVGVAIHEITHGFGRFGGLGNGFFSPQDLFRYSAPGTRNLTFGDAAYFSLDRGATNLNNFDRVFDAGDWATSGGPFGNGPGSDANNAFIRAGVVLSHSQIDVAQLDALGFNVVAPVVTAAISTSAYDARVGNLVSAGGTLTVLTSALSFAATIFTGGRIVVSSGGRALDSYISGGSQTVTNSGIASATLLFAGGVETVSSGGRASGTTVSAGGLAIVAAGGVAVGAIGFSGGAIAVNGGVTSGTKVSNGASELVSNGGIASATAVSSGGTQQIGSAGSAISATIGGGGLQFVLGGTIGATTLLNNGVAIVINGVTSGMRISAGGFSYVEGATGVGTGTIVLSGGVEQALFGGVVSGTSVSSGGLTLAGASGTLSGARLSGGAVQIVLSGGTARGTQVLNNGLDYVQSGGVASGEVVSSGGAVVVLGGGVTAGTTLSSGGLEVVSAGGIASGALVSNGGYEIVLSGGVARNMQVLNGGLAYVQSGGVASGGTITGGVGIVLGGGSTSGVTIATNGIEVISAGGVASATTIGVQGYEIVLSGGIARGATLSSGGNLIVSGGGILSGTIAMPGVNNVVTLGSGANVFSASFSDFNLGDYFDLKGVGYTAGITSLSYTGNAAGGLLTVTSGAQSVSLSLLGQYVAGNFTLQTNGAGGTLVGDPPVSSGTLAHA